MGSVIYPVIAVAAATKGPASIVRAGTLSTFKVPIRGRYSIFSQGDFIFVHG